MFSRRENRTVTVALSVLAASGLFSSCSGSCWAAIGRIVKLDGEAAIHRANERLSGFEGSEVLFDDTIVFSRGTRAVIYMDRGIIIHSQGATRMKLPPPQANDLQYIPVWNGEVRIVSDGTHRVAVQTMKGTYVVRRGILQINCNRKRTIVAAETGDTEIHLGPHQQLLAEGDWARCGHDIETHSGAGRFRPLWSVGPLRRTIAQRQSPGGVQLTSFANERPRNHSGVTPTSRPCLTAPPRVPPQTASPSRASAADLASQFSLGPVRPGSQNRQPKRHD